MQSINDSKDIINTTVEDIKPKIKTEILDYTENLNAAKMGSGSYESLNIKSEEIFLSDEETDVSSFVKTEPGEYNNEYEMLFENFEQNEFVSLDVKQEFVEENNDDVDDPLADNKLLQEQDAGQTNTAVEDSEIYHSKEQLLYQLMHHTNKSKHVCDSCNQTYTNKNQLFEHLFHHLQNYTKPYECSICNMDFKHKTGLEKHLIGHSKETHTFCIYCEQTFTSADILVEHVRTHNMLMPYKCTICNISFKYSKALKKHKRIHNNKKQYKCLPCNRLFINETNLEKHINVAHTEMQHKCPFCNKSFTKKSYLERHKGTHNKNRMSCNYCLKSYTDKSNLFRHIKKMHDSRIKAKVVKNPFYDTCQVCNKDFSTKSNFQLHANFCAMRQEASYKIRL